MGEIFLARQVGLAGFDRLVILKTMLPELAEEEGLVEQFLDEARVAAKLNHPNIVSMYEVGEWQGRYFIAMEYISGDHVGRLLMAARRAGLKMPPLVAAKIIHDAALALDHAHTARDVDGTPLTVVHRDVSPQNIMVRDDGVTKVIDFGIARAANRSVRTRTGCIKGKAPYMAPEQIAGKPLDGRTDQFALGIVFWELLTHERLFYAENDVDVLRMVLNYRIPPPSSVVPNVPPELDEVVLHMLERAPEARYVSCGAVAESTWGMARSRTIRQTRSATAWAPARSVLGMTMANSSPP